MTPFNNKKINKQINSVFLHRIKRLPLMLLNNTKINQE